MKIAFTTEYSYPSKCGVWNTVYNTAKELQKKGHEIHIFSSNIIKGTSQKSKSYEIIEGITYHRFPVLFKIGENGRVWLFQKHLKNLKPDIIHSHSFRHFHSCLTPFIAKKLKIPCYLTTHGPFLEDGVRNSFTQLLVDSFDLISGRYVLNSYRKVFAISKWEIPFLLTLGCKKNKIPENVINQMWDTAVEFGNYAFNAAHCLSEDQVLYEKSKKQFLKVSEIKSGMILDSYVNGNSVEDEVVQLIDTGEQEVYEVEFSNGLTVECTINHRFLCSDHIYRKVTEILEGDYEVVSEV